MAFTYYQAQPVLDLIGKYESRGDYDIVYGGIPQRLRPMVPLTQLTIAEVMDWQNRIVKQGVASTAAGKYQIIRKTLAASVAATGIDTRRKFDKAAQDELGMHLLAGRGFQRFINGKISANDMMIGLAKEWASFPVPFDMRGQSRQVKAGQSYYSGDGLNKAHAKIAEVKEALAASRNRPVIGPVGARPDQPAGSLIDAIKAIIAAIFGGKK